MDRSLLDLLVCPGTHQPLQRLDATALARVNAAIAEARVQRADGQPQASALREALRTPDGARVYRVDDGIPVLLVDESLDTRGLDLQ